MTFSTLALASCLLLPAAASATDLKIVTRHSVSTRFNYTSTEYVSGPYSRHEIDVGSDNMKGHHLAHIYQKTETGGRRFVLDLEGHEYATYETDRYGVVAGARRGAIFPSKSSGGTLEIWIESKDTGERQEMFGHTVRHIITKERRVPGAGSCSHASELETDGWYIDYSVLPEAKRPLSGVNFIPAGNCRDKIEFHRSGVQPGFPMKVTIRQTQHLPEQAHASDPAHNTSSISEVIEFSEAPLDPALFQVPADFRQVKEFSSMDKPSLWEEFKTWVREVFSN
ncbi:MAG TPA: hypothetical protein VKD65_00580 [Candidatus Angelobacter sp.]|nr:hypothetical protein [Candidatus Angelobacter sp.]